MENDSQEISEFPGDIIQDSRITRSKAKKLAMTSSRIVLND